MPRSSMAALITRVRTMVYDPAGAAQTFTDDQVQNALDTSRTEQRFRLLQMVPSFQPGGAVQYLDYYADVGNWEDDYLLQDASYATITGTADVVEPIPGHWHFPTQPNGFAVHITGKTYDLFAAAADLCDAWAGITKLDFMMVTDRDRFERQQKFQMLTDLAQTYRAQAQVRVTRMQHSEISPAYDGGGVVYPSWSGVD